MLGFWFVVLGCLWFWGLGLGFVVWFLVWGFLFVLGFVWVGWVLFGFGTLSSAPHSAIKTNVKHVLCSSYLLTELCDYG